MASPEPSDPRDRRVCHPRALSCPPGMFRGSCAGGDFPCRLDHRWPVKGGDPVTHPSIDGDGMDTRQTLEVRPAWGALYPNAHSPRAPRRPDQYIGRQRGKHRRGDPG
nr:hypothetical protein CFP56_79601 [Quercus suber]